MKADDPGQEVAVHAERRRRLAAVIGEGVAVIPTAPERARNRDSHYPYRYDSYFYYLTGFQEPEAVLVLAGGAEPRALLYCREKNPERETWDGFRHGPEGARERFGFDEAHAIAALDEAMPALLADRAALWYPVGADAEWDARAMRWLNAVRANARAGVAAPQALHDVRAPLDEMRLLKDAHELALMRRAAAISAAAHRRAMLAARPGRREYEVEAELLHESGRAARSSRPIRRSWPEAPTPACCTTCRTTRCSMRARCCWSTPAASSRATPPTSRAPSR